MKQLSNVSTFPDLQAPSLRGWGESVGGVSSGICIFDLDGTLLNTIADLGTACNHALAAFGFPLHSLDEYPHLVGNGVNRLIERALPVGHKDEATVLRLREVFVPYYDTHNCVHTQPYEGVPELLLALRQRGFRLAVASNKYQAATAQLVEHFFPDTFDVVFGERPNVPRKPDPQIVYDILTRLSTINTPLHSTLNSQPSTSLNSQLSTNNCPQLSTLNSQPTWYIGDSLVDIATARNAGLPMIACAWGFCSEKELEEAHPDLLAHHPADILSFLTHRQ